MKNLEGFKINCMIHSSNEKLCVVCQVNLDDLPQICKKCWYICEKCRCCKEHYKDKRTISIHDFWNNSHDIITIEWVNADDIEDELIKLGYKIDNINWMDITRQKNEEK